jgi:hypothetical protein
MTKLKLTRALFLGAIVLGLFLAGCDTGLPSSEAASQDSNAGNAGTGTGTVTLNVGLEGIPQAAQSAARTVYPALDEVFYEADFGNSDVRPLTGGLQKIELANGTYTITVTAYRNTGETDDETGAEVRAAIADKKLSNVKVQPNADTNAVFLLKPKTDAGDGTFHYSIQIPEEFALAEGSELVIGEETTPLAGGPVEDTVTLAAGSYPLRLTLKRGEDPYAEYAGFSQTIYIYAGLVTELPEELSSFDDGDFSTKMEPIELDFAKPVARDLPESAVSPTAEYYGTIKWEDGEDTALKPGAKFLGNVAYKANVTLTANDGFTFTGLGEDDITYAEAEDAVISELTNTGRRLDFLVTFATTERAVVREDLLDLPALTVQPKLKAEPEEEVSVEETDEFEITAAIDWTDVGLVTDELADDTPDVFDGDTVYVAKVTLTPKEGFTFKGIDADSFTYNKRDDVEVKNTAAEDDNALVVSIYFPATDRSNAQIAADDMGLPRGTVDGLYTVAVTSENLGSKTKATVAGATLPADVALSVGDGVTLTVDSGTLTVAKELTVSETGVLKSTGGAFATTGDGVIEVNDGVSLATLGANANGALKVTLATAAELALGKNPLALGSGVELTVADDATLTVTGTAAAAFISGGKSVATAGDSGKIVLGADGTNKLANGKNFEWATSKAVIIDDVAETFTLEVAKDAELGGNVTVKAGSAVTVAAEQTLTVPQSRTLTVLAEDFTLTGTLAVTGTGQAVIGTTASNVTLKNATIAGADDKDAILNDGGAGVITLVDTDTLTLANGGSFTVKGTGAKVAGLHSEFGAGTYTAAGAVEFASLEAADTLTVKAGKADDGLILASGSSTATALKLLSSDGAAAEYVLTAVPANGGGVRIAGNNITVGAAVLATSNASTVKVPAKGKIVLGAGGINLGNGSILTLTVGGTIGVLTDKESAPTYQKKLGTATVGAETSVFTNTQGTIGVGTANGTFTGASTGASRIFAGAVIDNS